MNNIEYKCYKNINVCDSHIHLVSPEKLDVTVNKFREIMEYYCCERLGLMCLTTSGHRKYDHINNVKALYIKSLFNSEKPDSTFVYGSCVHSYNHSDTKEGYLQQVRHMYEMGVDGYKSLDGNPANRKALGKPLCNDIFDDMYEFIESHNMPIKMHVGQPPYFWGDKSSLTPYEISRGWWFGDGTYPPLEELRQEIDGTLQKFPNLKLCLAHFYFLGHDIDKATSFFEKWDNVSFDLTPGKEMFKGFSEKHHEWKAFFEKYAHRIYFGTDTYNNPVEGYDLSKYHYDENQRHNLVRHMLEKSYDEVYDDGAGGIFHPLGLGDETLKKIYIENHKALHPTARPLNTELILEECERLISEITTKNIPFENEWEYGLEEENLKVIIDYFKSMI